MDKKKISIVIPTINREKEIRTLLDSIVLQKYQNLEIIIVDQNKKIDLRNTLTEYENKLSIQHYKVDFKGASKARNYGAQKATGEILAFPDDDCIYAEGVLEYINENFSKNTEIDAIFGRIKDRESQKNILKFKRKDCKVRKINIYQTTIEASMFIKIDVFKKIGMYDEMLGVGRYFGAEESADLVCRLLYEKYNLQYYSKIFLYHPSKCDEKLVKRIYKYNLGLVHLYINILRYIKKCILLLLF